MQNESANEHCAVDLVALYEICFVGVHEGFLIRNVENLMHYLSGQE